MTEPLLPGLRVKLSDERCVSCRYEQAVEGDPDQLCLDCRGWMASDTERQEDRRALEAIERALHAEELSDFQRLLVIGMFVQARKPLTDKDVRRGRALAEHLGLLASDEPRGDRG